MQPLLLTSLRDERYFPLLLHGMQKQTLSQWQWALFVPSGAALSCTDARIQWYDQAELPSWLAARSHAECLIPIDEHAYYAPPYVEFMMQQLAGCDICTLNAWFAYDQTGQFPLYYSAEEPLWTSHSPIANFYLFEMGSLKGESPLFAYAFRGTHASGAAHAVADQKGLVVQCLPTAPIDRPYYRLPPFLFQRHIPSFSDYLQAREHLCLP